MIAAAALLLAAAVPLATVENAPDDDVSGVVAGRSPDRPVFGSFELRLSGYRPNIDSEFTGGVHPFQDVFGSSRPLMFRAHFGKSLWHGFGTLEVGLGAGYYSVSGHGLLADGTPSSDTTALKIIPMSATLTYRLDYGADHYGFPLVPYVRASLEHYQWWVENGTGSTASSGGFTGSGGTNGYSFTGGIAFLLDFLDPGMARDMEQDTGIHHTYLYVDLTKSYINDFGSAKSWNLSDDKLTIAGGLLLVF